MRVEEHGEVALQLVGAHEAHEAVHMQRVVLVRHLHPTRAAQATHVQEALVAQGVEAARDDVRRRQVLERVDEKRGHLGVEQTRQQRGLHL